MLSKLYRKLRRWWYHSWIYNFWLCRTKRCSYYRHYLVYGGPELLHRPFHAAELQCEYWQKRLLAWLDAHENDRTPEPKGLIAICEQWERRIRA